LIASLTYAAQGEKSGTDIFDKGAQVFAPKHADFSLLPPSGTPTKTWTVSLLGTLSPFDWLDLAFQPGYKRIENHNHISGASRQGLEFVFSVKVQPH
jgi:hypothetical protein